MSSKADDAWSRRAFLAGATAGAAGLWIDVSLPRTVRAMGSRAVAEDESGAQGGASDPEGMIRRSLSPDEWREVEAVTARILPTDDTPGAREAGCVGYIDRALAEEDADARPRYRAALAALEALCQDRIGVSFSSGSPAQQDAILHELEEGAVRGWSSPEAPPDDFFQTIRMHTILGFVLDPRYGGNRDYAGWRTVGFPGAVHHLGGSRPEQMRGDAAFPSIWERSGAAEAHDSASPARRGEGSSG
jgi:gluconate 2-dehydrogenase gamma chain